jgi:hypothetical protein
MHRANGASAKVAPLISAERVANSVSRKISAGGSMQRITWDYEITHL